MSSRELIKLLQNAGWYEVPQKSTSHRQFKHLARIGKVTIPHPVKDIPIGTYKAVLKQAGIN
jgi:predicted RNA binding protein YcfA (HicA-like mRNA interferase family)